MIKILTLSIIIVFLTQSGNAFSNSNLFDVDNIIINEENHQSKEELLDYAFKIGFTKLVNKIVLKKDFNEALSINSNKIKGLISRYQIIESKKNNNKKKTINISFNREKINELFYTKKILYSDITNTKIVLFPILENNNNFNLFAKNYFYSNWLKEENEKNNLIEYILPLESAELIKLINNKNIDSIPAEKFALKYEVKNYLALIIKPSNDKVEVFLKGKISNNNIVKNLKFEKNNDDEKIIYSRIIKKIKFEINDIWKYQNLIDVRTPSFVNIILDIKKNNDLLNLQIALNNIDLIDNYQVLELNKNYAKIKIKYLGSVNKIKNKFSQQNILITIIDNRWNLKLI